MNVELDKTSYEVVLSIMLIGYNRCNSQALVVNNLEVDDTCMHVCICASSEQLLFEAKVIFSLINS